MAAPDLRRSAEAPAPATPAGRGDIRARRPGVSGGILLARLRRGLSVLALATVDVGGVGLAVFAGLATMRFLRGDHPVYGGAWLVEETWLPYVLLIVLQLFANQGLYRAREARPTGAKVISSLALATIVLFLFAVLTGQRMNSFAIFPTTFVYAAVIVTALRASYDSITLTAMRVAGVRRRTLVAGPAHVLADLREKLRQSSERGPDVEVIGAATTDGDDARLFNAPTLGAVADLPALVERHEPDDLVLVGVELSDAAMLELAERCRERRTRLRVVPTTTQLLVDRATFVPGQSVPLLELKAPVLIGIDWALKRGFDLVVSGLLLTLLSPMLLVIGVLVKLTSPGPVIYRDRRVGVGEREFDMLKFRSMYQDASDQQAGLEALNEADGALFKIRRDPRVTPVGRVLRRLSLDELPQLVNVLRREMSLVGPRPLPLRDYRLLEEWHRKRYLVLPGITGLWQTSRRSTLSFDDLVRLDFFYFENWSVWLDIVILVRTPLAVLRGHGAF